MTWHRRLIATAGLIGAAGIAVAAAPPGGAANDSIFSMQARADALGVQVVGSGFPVVANGELVFATPATAQSSLDPTSSQGFASAPYPGDTFANLPTTVNGLGAGSLPPVPSVPFYVTSSYPTQPRSSQQIGPYVIATESQPISASSDAKIGLSTFAPQVLSVTAHSSVMRDPQTGRMVAEATTDIAPFNVNGLLSVGEIRSSSVLVHDPAKSAAVDKQTSLSVGTITIAGVEVGLTDKGLVLAGQRLVPVDVSALSALLAPSGVTIAYVPGHQTATSVTSAAVEITFRKKLPAPFLDTTVGVVLGRVSATAVPGSTVGSGAATGTGTSTPVASGPAPQPAVADTSATPAGPGPSAVALPASPTVVAAPPVAAPTRPAGYRKQTDVRLLFWVLAVGAALALASSHITRWLAFRLRLSS